MHISLESGILVAEQFLQDLFKKYEKYPSPLMVGMVPATMWIFEITSSYSLILLRKEYHYRTNYSIHKTRTEMFDDYFPCQKDNCTLEHVRNWFNLFVDVHSNSMIIFTK